MLNLILAILIGFVVGFIMCIPVGPLNLIVVNTFLKYDKKSAMKIAIGASIMDVISFTLILSGILKSHLVENYMPYFRWGGIFFMLVWSIHEIIKPPSNSTSLDLKKSPHLYLQGILIYIATPTLLITLTALCSFVLSLNLIKFSFPLILLFSVSVAIGSAFWFVTILHFLGKINAKNKLANIGRYTGIFVLVMTLIFIYKIIQG